MPGELQQRLGRNLRRWRAARQMSQEELADYLQVHRTYIGGLERGERNPSLQVVERLAEDLDIEPLALLQDGDEQAAPVLRAADGGSPGGLPDARKVPPRRRPAPDA